MEDWLNVWLADRKPFQYLWLIWMASTWTLHRCIFWTSKNVAGWSTWRHISLWLSCWFRLAKYSTCLPSWMKRQKQMHYAQVLRPDCDYNVIYVHLIIWASTLSWPGGLERLGTLSDCSGVPKMFEAILWGFLDAAASSSYPPNRLLEPPPGGRKTLQKTRNCNTTSPTIHFQLLDGKHSYMFPYIMENTTCWHLIQRTIPSWSRLMFKETCFGALTTETQGVLCISTENNNFVSIWSNNSLSCLLYYTGIGVRLKNL